MKVLNNLETDDKAQKSFGDPAFIQNKEVPIHRWVNWIAGFSGTFVASSIARYLPIIDENTVILDPFAGVGTTLLEGFRHGANVIGFEINPFAALVAELKLRCAKIELNAVGTLVKQFYEYMDLAEKLGVPSRIRPPQNFKTRIPFFSDEVLRQVLWVMEFISDLEEPLQSLMKVAFGSVMVSFSNYTYEPSLGSRPAAGKPLVLSAPVAEIVGAKLEEMYLDIMALQEEIRRYKSLPVYKVYQESFFEVLNILKPLSVDLVVTSPPYMNNYHYVRNTRPQLFWLGFVSSASELRKFEENNFGKSWQAVREEKAINVNSGESLLIEIVEEIRKVAPEKGPYGGPGWANYVASYFNDMERFLGMLSYLLKPSGKAVIVIGNSIIQGIEIKVDGIMSMLGKKFNLETEGVYMIRKNRTGSSVVGSGSRRAVTKKPFLYDAAVVFRKD